MPAPHSLIDLVGRNVEFMGHQTDSIRPAEEVRGLTHSSHTAGRYGRNSRILARSWRGLKGLVT